MRDRFDIDQVIKITGLGIHAEQAYGGADFDVACQIVVKKLWKIKEYESLEEQGKLLKLPCAVGGTVWFIKSNFAYMKNPKAEKVRKIEIIDEEIIFRTENRCFEMKRIGKTVFLTEEEAEAALKEL